MVCENSKLLTVITKGCDSNFEVKFSNFQSCYKWNNYLPLNDMYTCTRIALENYNNNDLLKTFTNWLTGLLLAYVDDIMLLIF